MERRTKEGHMLDIWFFVALVLAVYGVILVATGIYYVINPYERTVLSGLHPNLWWGALMIITGGLFWWISFKGNNNAAQR